MKQLKIRQHKFSPRGPKTYRALKLIGLLGFATVRQLCLIVWGNERSTNDNVNRLLEQHYLQQAHESIELGQGRGNRIVFLTRTGMSFVLKEGQVREEDIVCYWRGEGHWHPLYNEHRIAVNDVLCAFIKRAMEHPGKAIDLRLDPHAPLISQFQTPYGITPLADKSLIPDRIFAVKYSDQVLELYLEVDRGTESKNIWREKMEKYLKSPEVMDQVGVTVLCVAHTPSRLHTLLDWSRDLVNEKFLFTSLGQVCYIYERKGKELVLVSEGDPFGKIWRRGVDLEKHSLFMHNDNQEGSSA